jgi:hypothetical protein
MEEYLFYEQHAKSDVNNSRHGRMTKRIKTGHGGIAPTLHVTVMALLSLS